jgi:hypothetical protein
MPRYGKRSRGIPGWYRGQRPQRTIGAPNSLYNARARGTEVKFYDQSNDGYIGKVGSGFGAAIPVIVSLIDGLAVGTDWSARIGRRITIRSLNLRYNIYGAATPPQDTSVRILLIYDKQCNGALPAMTDILVTNASSGFVDTCSQLQMNNRDRFVIIRDIVKTQQYAGPGGLTEGKIFKKLRTEIQWNNTSGGDAAIQTGNLILVLIPDSNSQAQNAQLKAPYMNWYSRIRFTDV